MMLNFIAEIMAVILKHFDLNLINLYRTFRVLQITLLIH